MCMLGCCTFGLLVAVTVVAIPGSAEVAISPVNSKELNFARLTNKIMVLQFPFRMEENS